MGIPAPGIRSRLIAGALKPGEQCHGRSVIFSVNNTGLATPDQLIVQDAMKKQVLFLAFFLILSLKVNAAFQAGISDSVINDGPYIFLTGDTIRVIRIENNQLREDYLLPGKQAETILPSGQSIGYKELSKVHDMKPRYRHRYNRIDSIAVISDVHGHYDTYLDHLLANGIIDKDLNWNFGKGHLVFLGDAFDRGDQVTEILWHLFKLEGQAAKNGGMVHFILGNHESMVLAGDLRYIHEKYRQVEAISGADYTDLYSGITVLGRWLRSKPAMITINNILFVHAGVSPQLLRKGLKIKQVNQIFAERIIGKEISFHTEDEDVKLLSGNEGPLWYRGFFTDTTLTEENVNAILDFYGKELIVVGHTPQKNITTLFDKKVIGVDTGIGYGQPGYMLIYKEGSLFRGHISGARGGLSDQPGTVIR